MLVEVNFSAFIGDDEYQKVSAKDLIKLNYYNPYIINNRITVNYSDSHSYVFTARIDYDEHFHIVETKDFIKDITAVFKFISNVMARENPNSDIRFSFYAYGFDGCKIIAQENEDEQIRALQRNLYLSDETELKMDIEYLPTRIWDMFSIILNSNIRSKSIHKRNFKFLNIYETEVRNILNSLLEYKLPRYFSTKEFIRIALKNLKAQKKTVDRLVQIALTSLKLSEVPAIQNFSDHDDEIMKLIEIVEGLEDEDEISKTVEIIKDKIREKYRNIDVVTEFEREFENFVTNYFTIGGDPEIMGFEDKNDKYPTDAYEILNSTEPDTYYNNMYIGYIGTDGNNDLYEIRPSASNNPFTLLARYIRLLEYGEVDNVNNYGIIKEYIELWDTNVDDYPLGGHIHIGSRNSDLAKHYSKRAADITKKIDTEYKLERIFYVMSSEERRRQGYAKSSFETKPWGFEYRTPPAIVWTEPKLFIPTTTALTLIAFREYLEWKEHSKAEELNKIIDLILEDTVAKIKKMLIRTKNSYYYTHGDDERIVKLINEAMKDEGINIRSIDQILINGTEIYLEYVRKILLNAVMKEGKRVAV